MYAKLEDIYVVMTKNLYIDLHDARYDCSILH